MMEITRINVKNYKKIKEIGIGFNSGLNVIYGKNESGKSTLLDAIYDALFQDPASNAKSVLSLFTWGSLHKPFLNIEFRDHGKEYSITKDFNHKSVELYAGNQLLSKNNREILSVLSNIIGYSDPLQYKSISYFETEEIINIKKSKIANEFIKMSSDSDTDITSTLSKIDEDISELEKGLYSPSKTQGIILDLQNRINEKSNILEKMQHDLYENTNRLKILADFKRLNVEKEREIKNIETLLDNNDKYTDALKAIDEIKSNISLTNSTLNELKELRDKQKNLSELLEKNNYFKLDEYVNSVNLIHNYQQSIDSIDESIEDIKNSISETNDKEENIPNLYLTQFIFNEKIKIILWIITIIMVGISFVNRDYLIIGIILFIISSLYTLSSYFFQKRTENVFDKHQRSKSDLINIKKELELLIEKKNIEKKQINDILTVAKCNTVEELILKKSEVYGIEARISQNQEYIENKLTSLGSIDIDNAIVSIQSKIQDLFQRKQGIEMTDIVPLESTRIDQLQYTEYENKLDVLHDESDELEKKCEDLQKGINYSLSSDSVNEVEEDLEAMKYQWNYFSNKLNSLKIARDFITQAISNTSSAIGTVARLEIEKYLPNLTKGKYSKVTIDPNLNLKVYSEEKNDYVSPNGVLSTSTNEAIFLLAKVAFINLLSNNKFPPLFFDDPLVNFDSERFLESLDVFQEISNSNQIFIFTCDSKYLKYAKIINIDENATV